MVGKEHVTFAFLRGAALPDPQKLLEGTGKGVRHVKMRGVADVMRPGVKKLIAEAARLNKKDPPSGMMVGMESGRVERKRRSEVRKETEITKYDAAELRSSKRKRCDNLRLPTAPAQARGVRPEALYLRRAFLHS